MVEGTRSAPPVPERIGRYQIQGVLGAGAMGAVYKGYDPLIKRTLAIKTLRLDIPRGTEDYKVFLERFYQEARISGTLAHPNIVTLFDIGEDSGLPFLAFEHIEGETVEAALARGIKFRPEKVIALISQIASAVDYAHSKGVIHRDIKPANLLLFEDDKIKITDFGIAKLAESEMTRAGQLLGTPSYMSPEQAMGEKVDGRCDIFALGVVAFEMLSGQQPFPGNNVTAILYRLVHMPPIEPANLEMNGLIPAKFHEVFSRVLSKNRDERYQTGADFVRDLELTLGSWFTGLEELTPAASATGEEPYVVELDEVSPADAAPARPAAPLPPQEDEDVPATVAMPGPAQAAAPTARPAAPLPPEDEDDLPETVAIPAVKRAEPAPAAAEEQEATVVLPSGPSPVAPPVSATTPPATKPPSTPPGKVTFAKPSSPSLPSRFGSPVKSGSLRIPPRTTGTMQRGAGPGSGPPGTASRPPAPPSVPPQMLPAPRAGVPMGIVAGGAVALLLLGVGLTYFALRGGSSSGGTNGGGTAQGPVGRGSIRVESQPSGARVSLNGKPRGSTPTTLDGLAAGSYEVVAEADQHEPAFQNVTLKDGDATASVSLKLASSRNVEVEADILSRPAGANVLVDGQKSGQTPLRGMKLRVGNRRVVITTEGYQPWTGFFTVEEGKEARLEARLQPLGSASPAAQR
jgi:serine/threonine protein kinase